MTKSDPTRISDDQHNNAPAQECGNCFEGKSDMDHDCQKCGGTGFLPAAHQTPTEPTK